MWQEDSCNGGLALYLTLLSSLFGTLYTSRACNVLVIGQMRWCSIDHGIGNNCKIIFLSIHVHWLKSYRTFKVPSLKCRILLCLPIHCLYDLWCLNLVPSHKSGEKFVLVKQDWFFMESIVKSGRLLECLVLCFCQWCHIHDWMWWLHRRRDSLLESGNAFLAGSRCHWKYLNLEY